MRLEEALYAHLSGDADVAALVGDRIYPLLVPQDADLPALAYQRISGVPIYAHDGPPGLARARVQITCLGRSYSEAKDLAARVRAALSGYRGTMGGAGGVEVGAAFIENHRDELAEAFGPAPVARLDCLIWYQEA